MSDRDKGFDSVLKKWKFPEINFSENGYELTPLSLIRAHQDFVPKRRVEQFIDLYLSGEPVEAPEAYFDEDRGFWVIQDGHCRARALTDISLSGVDVVGKRQFEQPISYAFYLKPFVLPANRHPHTKLYEIDKIELKEDIGLTRH